MIVLWSGDIVRVAPLGTQHVVTSNMEYSPDNYMVPIFPLTPKGENQVALSRLYNDPLDLAFLNQPEERERMEMLFP